MMPADVVSDQEFEPQQAPELISEIPSCFRKSIVILIKNRQCYYQLETALKAIISAWFQVGATLPLRGRIHH